MRCKGGYGVWMCGRHDCCSFPLDCVVTEGKIEYRYCYLKYKTAEEVGRQGRTIALSLCSWETVKERFEYSSFLAEGQNIVYIIKAN